jgi:hypothetical protein
VFFISFRLLTVALSSSIVVGRPFVRNTLLVDVVLNFLGSWFIETDNFTCGLDREGVEELGFRWKIRPQQAVLDVQRNPNLLFNSTLIVFQMTSQPRQDTIQTFRTHTDAALKEVTANLMLKRHMAADILNVNVTIVECYSIVVVCIT